MKIILTVLFLSVFVLDVFGRFHMPTVPSEVCGMNRNEKKAYLACVRPHLSEDYRQLMDNFLDCTHIQRFVTFVDLTCRFNEGHKKVAHITNCLSRYPQIRNMPINYEQKRRCVQEAEES